MDDYKNAVTDFRNALKRSLRARPKDVITWGQLEVAGAKLLEIIDAQPKRAAATCTCIASRVLHERGCAMLAAANKENNND